MIASEEEKRKKPKIQQQRIQKQCGVNLSKTTHKGSGGEELSTENTNMPTGIFWKLSSGFMRPLSVGLVKNAILN